MTPEYHCQETEREKRLFWGYRISNPVCRCTHHIFCSFASHIPCIPKEKKIEKKTGVCWSTRNRKNCKRAYRFVRFFKARRIHGVKQNLKEVNKSLLMQSAALAEHVWLPACSERYVIVSSRLTNYYLQTLSQAIFPCKLKGYSGKCGETYQNTMRLMKT